jgi:hypothetical protein
MKVSIPPRLPAMITAGYLASLLVTVIALISWPFSPPLIGLLWLLLILFFLVAIPVTTLAYFLVFRTIWVRIVQWNRRSPLTKSDRKASAPQGFIGGQHSELWDPWLDGI